VLFLFRVVLGVVTSDSVETNYPVLAIILATASRLFGCIRIDRSKDDFPGDSRAHCSFSTPFSVWRHRAVVKQTAPCLQSYKGSRRHFGLSRYDEILESYFCCDSPQRQEGPSLSARSFSMLPCPIRMKQSALSLRTCGARGRIYPVAFRSTDRKMNF